MKYIKYFLYILEHKKNVFKTCWKRKLYIHAFTHDLSKFLPSEFIPYANWFYGQYGVNIDKESLEASDIKIKHCIYKSKFRSAWKEHYKRNKHHWNYWVGKRIPHKHIMQMICDWEAMSLKFGGTAQQYYMKNYNKIDLTVESRCELEFILGLLPGELLCSNVIWKQACENLGISMEEDLKQLGYIK